MQAFVPGATAAAAAATSSVDIAAFDQVLVGQFRYEKPVLGQVPTLQQFDLQPTQVRHKHASQRHSEPMLLLDLLCISARLHCLMRTDALCVCVCVRQRESVAFNISIDSNYGNPSYTCIYRLRIHSV